MSHTNKTANNRVENTGYRVKPQRHSAKSIATVAALLVGSATVTSISGCATGFQTKFTGGNKQAQQQNNDAVIMKEARTHFIKKNYRQSLPLLQYLAKRRHDEAQYALGYMFYYGIGVSSDKEAALTWMQLAASKNNKRAQIALERHYAMNA